jgi:UDP-N-acetylglucosamine 2-epimerase
MQTAPFSSELSKHDFKEVIVHTGQHYDDNMSQCFFDELGIPAPNYNLQVGSGRHGAQTAAMLTKIEEVLLLEKPDAVIVDGDTNSTAAGALAASKLNIPLIHIEAGLRSYDRAMPEEINRIIADHLGSLLCAPTEQALKNLKNEGLAARAELTGDLMYDCFLNFIGRADPLILQKLEISPQKYVLSTIHRAENVGEKEVMKNILSALNELPLEVILPCHPRTKHYLATEYEINIEDYRNIKFIEPVTYLEMLALEKNASCIITDSGGVQREAYFAQVPAVIVRTTTEWVEQLNTGWSVLGYTETNLILDAFEKLMNMTRHHVPLYGDGHAAAKIVEAIKRFLH